MAQKLIVRDIPAGEVDKLVKIHKQIGALSIKITKQDDGRFTVESTFPD